MVTIGGKHRKPKLPSQPQFVIEWALNSNRFATFGVDDKGNTTIGWIGDPNAADKFDSKYAAKSRIHIMADIPDSRVFRELETA
jgi:hypothetical protein